VLGLQFGQFEVHQRLAGAHQVALGDGDFGYPAADLGGKADLLRLDNAGQAQHVGVVAERPAEPQCRGGGEQQDRYPEKGFRFHRSDSRK
jgi:hypothetical protein